MKSHEPSSSASPMNVDTARLSMRNAADIRRIRFILLDVINVYYTHWLIPPFREACTKHNEVKGMMRRAGDSVQTQINELGLVHVVAWLRLVELFRERLIMFQGKLQEKYEAATKAEPQVPETIQNLQTQGTAITAKVALVDQYLAQHNLRNLTRQVRMCLLTKIPPESSHCRLELNFSPGSPSEQLYVDQLCPYIITHPNTHALVNQQPMSKLEQRIQQHIDVYGH